MRLDEAGINKTVLEIAVSQFCLEIIANHGYAAPRLSTIIFSVSLNINFMFFLGYATKIR